MELNDLVDSDQTRCTHGKRIDTCFMCTPFMLGRKETVMELINEETPAGAWFVYGWDTSAYPEALFDTEIEALRYAVGSGYLQVKFWEFGKTWDEIKNERGRLVDTSDIREPLGSIDSIEETDEGIVVTGHLIENLDELQQKPPLEVKLDPGHMERGG